MSSGQDRRAGDRTRVEPGSPVAVQRGGDHFGDLVDVGTATASVRLPAGAPPPEPGDQVCGVDLLWRGTTTRVGDGTVARTGDGGGRPVCVLAFTGDAATRLWDFRDRYRNPALRAPAPAPDTSRVEHVPGRGHYTEESRLDRLRWLRATVGADLDSFESVSFDPTRLTGNIENLVGGVMVPVGVAGPLRFRGVHASGDLYAPYATTEGCLVASASRGAQAISQAGGVTTQVVGQVMTRAPAYTFADARAAITFCRWVQDHFDEISAEAGLVSGHGRLVELDPVPIGRTVHVRFCYETGDAAGQNMTTACTWRAARWIVRRLEDHPDLAVQHFIVEGNVSGDKKLNHLTFARGRGIRVTAEAYLPAEVLREVLKVSPQQIRAAHQAILGGALHIGAPGYDINVANTIAAIFCATGQDIACAHESSLAILTLDPDDDGLYASLLLPGIIVGTVGGGTHLPNQRDALAVMGCAGTGSVTRFAEIVAGFCLALDLSTLSAIASGQFVAAHERLGRSRPVEWFTRADLSPAFFQAALRRSTGDDRLSVTSAEPITIEMESSILAELTSHRVRHLTGVHPYRIEYAGGDGRTGSLDLVVKVKPVDEEVMLMIRSMAVACGTAVASAYEAAEDRLPFRGSHVRELDLYESDDPRWRRHAPRAHATFRDDARETYVLGLERLHDDVELLNTIGDVSVWTEDRIGTAFAGLAEVHAVWYGREDELLRTGRFGPHLGTSDMVDMSPLWLSLGDSAHDEFPQLFTAHDRDRLAGYVGGLGSWWAELEGMRRTLIHNDFNPRNVCLRRCGDGRLTLCAYDWELACLHVPQRDVAEFLAFVLPADVDGATVGRLVDSARRALEAATGSTIHAGTWRRGYHLALRDFFVNRFLLYLMSHSFRDHRFLNHVAPTLRRLLLLEEGDP